MDYPVNWDLEVMPEEVREKAKILKRGLAPHHMLMAEWVIQNPTATLKQMGAFFHMSPTWLSQVMNSDMFKAHIATRLKDVQAVVTQSVPERMESLAKVACERMMETLETTSDPEVIVDSFDKVMHRYGYAPNAKHGMVPQGGTHIGQQNNNIFYLSPQQLAHARGALIEAHAAQPALPNHSQQTEDAEPAQRVEPEKLPASG